MPTWTILAWDEVAEGANDLFYWAPGAGLDWAGLMWKYLTKARLTRYRTELEYCQVKTYILALADIYEEYCWRAHEEPRNCEYVEWAEALELPVFRVGQLLGKEANFEPDETDNTILMNAGLRLLINQARDRVLFALFQQFGNAPLRLLTSLYCCSTGRYEDESSIDAMKLDLSFELLDLYYWVDQEVNAAKASFQPQKKRTKKHSTSVDADNAQQLSLLE